MIEQITLKEFLKFLSDCSGDEAIEKISQFLSCGLMIEGLTIEDVVDE